MKEKTPYESLYDMEVTPPANLWNNISSELDHHHIAQKVLQAEVVPPSNIWKKIERSLYPQKTSVSIFKYVAAAAVITGLAFVGNYLFQNYIQQQQVNDANYLAATANSDQSPVTLFVNEAENSFTRKKQPVVVAEEKKPVKKIIVPIDKVYYASNILPEKAQHSKDNIHVELRSFTDPEGNIVFNPSLVVDPNSNYLTITGPNGQQTRISSKFLPMITEINATKNQRGFYKNYPIPESENWRERFSDWRKKLIQQDSSKIPATNLIEIINKNTNGEDPK